MLFFLLYNYFFVRSIFVSCSPIFSASSFCVTWFLVHQYVSVLLTIGLSVAASLLLYFVSGILYQSFDGTLLLVSILSVMMIPLIWTAICLPLTYWFGFRSAQAMGLLIIVPMFYLIKYFEDGPGLASLTDTLFSYIGGGFLVSIILFMLSYVVSVLGYIRKR